MKKTNIFALLIIFLFVSCTNNSVFKKISNSSLFKKDSLKVKKVTQKDTPVPEFNDIETYIRPSYSDMDNDEIRRETFIAESPYLDITTKNLILKGKVRVGMYKEEVFASVGKPQNKIQTPTDFGMKEEWMYQEDVLTFENGVLKSVDKRQFLK